MSSQIPLASSPLDYAVTRRDGDVMAMVRHALETGNTQLAFQPVVTAMNTRKVAFYEGLIRLRDEGGRVIPAHQFMGNIEEDDLGREIDCASLSLGIRMLRQNPSMRISINTSARSMADGMWRDILTRELSADPHLGARLILEISESSAMLLHEVLVRFMAQMQPLGVAFALDGFGAGMMSFRYLHDFFFDLVKIDRCFVRDIQSSPDNQVLAEALLMVARQFEMLTVAEGVETEEEANVLRQIGAECLQGYLFGAPRFAI